jgi:hypothetical protein
MIFHKFVANSQKYGSQPVLSFLDEKTKSFLLFSLILQRIIKSFHSCSQKLAQEN